ncbi:MAG: microviridin/marinostatin family tricyclic proteinase inhibitor [Cyanobacteria bacterium P01_D01_bin.50]
MMSNDDSVAKNSSSVPFFARYLEGQFLTEVSEEEMDEVKGGIRFTRPPLEDIAYSLKYPSDNEDGNPGHQIVTKKYPSDIEDIGSGGHPMTKKYPSDADEAVTHKYPSDGDDDFSFDF